MDCAPGTPAGWRISGCADALLAITAIHWSLQAQSQGKLPAWKGSMIRGALGWALERVANAAPHPGWPGLKNNATFADALFNAQNAWDDQQAGSPWHLQVISAQTTWQPRETLAGSFLLFGSWPGWVLALWQECFTDMVATGFGADAPRFIVTRWDVMGQPWLSPPERPSHLMVRTLSAARLQDRGQGCTALEAPAIARSVLRRWRQLHLQLSETEPAMSLPYPELSRACDDLHGTVAAADSTPIRRWSNRQNRAVRMPGLTGEINITGPSLTRLAPILAQAPLLHIGKQPNFGLGMVECEWQTDDSICKEQS